MAHRLIIGLAFGLAALAGPLPAFAGSNNTLYLLQEGGNNSFSSDQSLATNSSIGSSDNPVIQNGPWNAATLTITGDGGQMTLSQTDQGNPLEPHWDYTRFPIDSYTGGNTATVSLEGSGVANITQSGYANRVTEMNLSGGSDGTISQTGYNNEAALTVTGGGAGTINQTGISNTAGLVADVSSGATVTLTQNGNGSIRGSSVSPITVTTNTSVDVSVAP